MVEAHGFDIVLRKLMGYVCTMTDVRVESVEHEDHGHWFATSGIAKSGEFYHFAIFIEYMEVNKIFLRKDMFSLRIGLWVLILFSIGNEFFPLFIGEAEVFVVFG